MLRIGLTGGIGAGKSAVSATFSQCGGVVVDGDVIAREVVEPGTEGLAALVDAFGDDILLPDGALNRPALAAKAFSSDETRATLNGIVHPLVGKRRAELIAAVPEDSVVVEDIPLLVESGMAPMFPLVVVVFADAEVRLTRLVEQRGMAEDDARARIAAQASDSSVARSPMSGWTIRVLPRRWPNVLVRSGITASRRSPPISVRATLLAHPSDWFLPIRSGRTRPHASSPVSRPRVGQTRCASTTSAPPRFPGWTRRMPSTFRSRSNHWLRQTNSTAALRSAGYPRIDDVSSDVVKLDARSTAERFDHSGDAALWRKRLHGSADPGRPTFVHLRVDGWPNQQFALLFVDWLKANPDVRDEYLSVKRDAERAASPDGDIERYLDVKEPWFLEAYRRAWDWADSSSWRP